MISLAGVAKTHSGPAGHYPVLRGIDLQVGAGELVALVGKSGSGKSTLLNLIGGIDCPSSGSIVVGATALEALREGPLAVWRGRNVGFVFQFFQLLPTLTALENVMLPMDFAGTIAVPERRARALALLRQVDIAAHANKLPAAMSGGEQQRVAIARALANDPRVILADEPTGNLDSATAREVFVLLQDLAAAGRTVLVVTHDADIGRMVDRRIELADGRITADTGAPRHAAGERA